MTGEAGGKLLLFGEHAAVYGCPAVGLGLPWRLRLRFLPACEDDGAGTASERLRDACGRIGVDTPPAGALEVRSQIPFGVGLGSSAALCVALARAVGSGAADSRGLWAVAHRAEHAFHGSPSGIDTGLALLGGVQRFVPRDPGSVPAVQPIAAQAIHLIAGFVPRRGDTAAHVAAVRRKVQAGAAEVRSAIDRLGAVVEPACRLLASSAPGRAVRLGELADEADTLLTGIGVGSPVVAELLEAARVAGATGGKISGGGGGGAFVAFVPDRATGLAVLDAVEERLPAGPVSAASLLTVAADGVALLADRRWPEPVTRCVRLPTPDRLRGTLARTIG